MWRSSVRRSRASSDSTSDREYGDSLKASQRSRKRARAVGKNAGSGANLPSFEIGTANGLFQYASKLATA